MKQFKRVQKAWINFLNPAGNEAALSIGMAVGVEIKNPKMDKLRQLFPKQSLVEKFQL